MLEQSDLKNEKECYYVKVEIGKRTDNMKVFLICKDKFSLWNWMQLIFASGLGLFTEKAQKLCLFVTLCLFIALVSVIGL